MYKNNTMNTENDQIGSFKIHHLEYAQIYEYWLNVIELNSTNTVLQISWLITQNT